jgi:2-oxoglutarate ferredoxin oxidoreductase subunit alpha
MGAVIGASMGGVKAMTATSGPGFSLKQENLGYGIMVEVPCVVVNVMRGGPSTGMPTRPSQGDIMQARWGTHGDHPIVVLTPASVAEIYDETIRAFAISEMLRTPVVVLYDEAVGHLVETVALPDRNTVASAERKWAAGPREAYQPFADEGDGIPAMARPGDGYRCHITGLTHGADGFPTQVPDEVDAVTRRLLTKLDRHRDRIDRFESVDAGDADILVVAIGIAARAAQGAVALARARGIKAGLFRPLTLWPFPEHALRAAAGRSQAILVPEMNAGQLSLEVERITGHAARIARLNRLTGEPLTPSDILSTIDELARHGNR